MNSIRKFKFNNINSILYINYNISITFLQILFSSILILSDIYSKSSFLV